MKKIIIAFAVMFLSACTPTVATVQADLLKVQSDLAVIAAAAQPVIKVATSAADFAERVTGNPELVPIINAVSAAVQAANIAVAKSGQ